MILAALADESLDPQCKGYLIATARMRTPLSSVSCTSTFMFQSLVLALLPVSSWILQVNFQYGSLSLICDLISSVYYS